MKKFVCMLGIVGLLILPASRSADADDDLKFIVEQGGISHEVTPLVGRTRYQSPIPL